MNAGRIEACTALAPLRYRIEVFDPKGHRFRVGFVIQGDALGRPGDGTGSQTQAGQAYPEKLVLHLAAWIPGSYMIREFAKHVLRVQAFFVDPLADPLTNEAKRKVLKISKTAKARWEITGLIADTEPLGAGQKNLAVYVEAIIYAWDLSVRAAHLDQSHGFFNPTSLCFRLEGAETLPCDIELIEPDPSQIKGSWEVATTLQRHEQTPEWDFGIYRAQNYDDLADHPVEMGSFSKFSFQACGVPHWLVVTGRHRFDASRVCDDLKKICETQINFFDREGKAPFKQFMFLLTVLGDGYGGLEHRDSTALICKRDDLPAPNRFNVREDGSIDGKQATPSEAYQRFLGLASHEYFHAWHVKRIKPAVFVDYDFTQENYTRLLWLFEGFTSYYDDLMLFRAQVISKRQYLKALESTINQVLRNPSRHVQSLADASFDAWIKYYRQDENAANALVSYYAKGAVVALCIDLLIRKETHQKSSLDDFMRFL
jgi:predicted metalloprotease with PDZ domain